MPVLTGSDIAGDVVGTFARDALIGVSDFASRALGAASAPAAPAAREPAPTPADPLLDLTLPESLRAWLQPAAEALALTIENGIARDKYGRLERRVTYLTDGGGIRRTLLHIPPKLLTDPSAYAFLNAVMWAMDENAFVAVFATDLMAPAPVNANVIDVLWKKARPMDSRFIAWSFVSELPTLALVDQIEFMRTRLGLETYEPRPQGSSSNSGLGSAAGAGSGPGKVSSEDIVRIVSILALLGYDDARARKTLLIEADLRDFAGSIDLVGSTNDVGSELILKLTQYRGTVPAGQRTAIGAFLRTIMGLQDCPPADAGWLNALIIRWEL